MKLTLWLIDKKLPKVVILIQCGEFKYSHTIYRYFILLIFYFISSEPIVKFKWQWLWFLILSGILGKFFHILKPIFHWKLGLRWLQNANEINTKKHEMYMANVKNLCLGRNTTYIPLTRVGVLRWVTQKYPTRMVLRRSGI